MNRTCKHTFRPGCEDLEGRQLLSAAIATPSGAATPSATSHHPHNVNPKAEVTALGATFVIVSSGVPGYSYQADVVSVNDPFSPLNLVTLPGGTTTSLNTGDAILALDGIPMDPNGVDLGIHEGPTTMDFVTAGSTTPQTGDIII